MSRISETNALQTREATAADLEAIRAIYNEAIADGTATLDTKLLESSDIERWFGEHADPYGVLVAEVSEQIVGWASLNAYSHRCAHRDIADLSVYVERNARGTGIGSRLLSEIDALARREAFRKIVLFAFASNAVGRHLYEKHGYREVGIFRKHGMIDGRPIDVVAMEKATTPFVLFVCKHNTGRSQMAEAFLRDVVGDDARVASAGTIAADRPDPDVIAAMAEIGIDISSARPKLLDDVTIAMADRIITMGCDVEGVPRIDDDWGLPDPKGASPERVREIRDIVRAKAHALAITLVQNRRI